jgi:hypothetical protein
VIVANEWDAMMRYAILAVSVLMSVIVAAEPTSPQLAPETMDVPGIVTNAVGEAIAGAEVFVLETSFGPDEQYADPKEIAKTATGADGRFLMKSVKLTKPRRDVWIRATADGFAYSGTTLSGAPDAPFQSPIQQGGSAEAMLILLPAEKLEGTVVDEQGAPIAGARVRGDSSRVPFTTGADGKFVFEKAAPASYGVHSGSRRLLVTHPDYAPVDMQSINPMGETIGAGPQTITMSPGVKLTGKVVDQRTGTGIANLGVSIKVPRLSRGAIGTRTDANGAYSVRVPLPTLPPVPNRGVLRNAPVVQAQIAVGSPDPFQPGCDYRAIVEPQPVDLKSAGDEVAVDDIECEPDVTLRGTIRMSDGSAPPPELAIFAYPPEGSTLLMKTGQSMRNIFAVPGLSAGKYELRVARWRTKEPTQEVLARQEVEVTDFPAPVEIKLKPLAPLPPADDASPLHGVVKDASGTPIKLAKIQVRGTGGGTIFSDLAGNYTLRNFARNQSSNLWAWSPMEDLVAVVAFPDDFDPITPLDITLKRGAEISGFVHDPAGEPMVDAMVSLAELRKQGRAQSVATLLTVKTNALGKYTLKGVVRPPVMPAAMEDAAGAPEIVVMVRPSFNRAEHFSATIGQRSLPEDLAEGQKLNGYDFTVDLSKPLIRVTADPEK